MQGIANLQIRFLGFRLLLEFPEFNKELNKLNKLLEFLIKAYICLLEGYNFNLYKSSL